MTDGVHAERTANRKRHRAQGRRHCTAVRHPRSVPFREREFDKDAEEFIVGWGQEFPRHSALKVIIHVPQSELASEPAKHAESALQHYFGYRADVLGRELNELFRIGRLSLVIGLAALAVCVLAASAISAALGVGNVSRFVEEGLIILGWVASWKPIQIFLYD